MDKILRYYGKDLQEIDFEHWLEQKPGSLQDVARRCYAMIQRCGPEVVMIFHDNHPIGCVQDAPFAYLNVFKLHLNLGFFFGADLPDPTHLLQGTGKRMQHIKITPEAGCDDAAMVALLRHAYLDINERLLTP